MHQCKKRVTWDEAEEQTDKDITAT